MNKRRKHNLISGLGKIAKGITQGLAQASNKKQTNNNTSKKSKAPCGGCTGK